MENEEIVTIKTYYSDAEADFAKNILEQNGIKAMVAGRTSIWAGGGASFSPELKVFKKDAERAIKILEGSKQPVEQKDKDVPMIKREFSTTVKVIFFIFLSIGVMLLISVFINR